MNHQTKIQNLLNVLFKEKEKYIAHSRNIYIHIVFRLLVLEGLSLDYLENQFGKEVSLPDIAM